MFKEDRVKLTALRDNIKEVSLYEISGETCDSVFKTGVYLEFLFYHILF